MMKSIGLLVIGILMLDVAVITVSFMQQSSKLTEAGANVSTLESRVTALNGELMTLRGGVAVLQSRLADSESKASDLQTRLTASQANATTLQTALKASEANATILQGPLSKTTPVPVPITILTPGIGPAAFTVSNLRINPKIIEPGNNVTVVVTVMNTGGEAGTYSLILKINEATRQIHDVKTQNVTLAGASSQNVSLTVPFIEPGEYVLTVDNISDIVEVAYQQD